MTRSKGEGAVYRDGDGWRAVVELPADPATGRRRRRYLRAPSKAAAIRRVREAQSALAVATPVASPSLRLSQWLATWIDRDVAPTRKPAMTAGYRSDAARHIVPVIGARPLASLAQSDVRALHAAMASKGLSAASIARVHAPCPPP